MNSQNSSLLPVIGKIFTSLNSLLFSIISLLILILFTYFYNNQFPNYDYPIVFKFLSYIA
ncbi:hypothetical protein ELS81_29960 [Bacillus sp. VKPM B-3276]|nr:hypothetical protein BK736_26475 [Bacillus thuringiensis serovar poloniensis]RNG39537.1 hypothetical protein EEL55_20145 [Bacillus thuringiensis]RUR59423.1 hypothetical protein ELS81_29960 [Bacillus sp. VKPM B-3276]